MGVHISSEGTRVLVGYKRTFPPNRHFIRKLFHLLASAFAELSNIYNDITETQACWALNVTLLNLRIYIVARRRAGECIAAAMLGQSLAIIFAGSAAGMTWCCGTAHSRARNCRDAHRRRYDN